MEDVRWKRLTYPVYEDTYNISTNGDIVHILSNCPVNMLYRSPNGYDFVLLMLDPTVAIACPNMAASKMMLFRYDLLMARAFIPVPLELKDKACDVIHKNGDTYDSSLENLAWVEDIEVWKPVENKYMKKGKYEVSSHGHVRFADTKLIVDKSIDSSGYENVELTTNENRRKGFKVHRLVAEAFYGPAPSEEEDVVNHINGNKASSNVKNLEYVTHSDNTRHAYMCGLIKKRSNVLAVSIDEMDMIREKLFETKGDVKTVFDNLDHEQYPKITEAIIRSIRDGGGSYNRSLKYTEEELKKLGEMKRHSSWSLLTKDKYDEYKVLLNDSGNNTASVYREINCAVSLGTLYKIRDTVSFEEYEETFRKLKR